MTQTIATIALAVFAVSMLLIGILSVRKTQTMEGFLLGGRNMGPWISAFAYGTSYFSAVVFIGYAGMHGWKIGIGSVWIGIGNALIGCYLAWKLLGAPDADDDAPDQGVDDTGVFTGTFWFLTDEDLCGCNYIYIFSALCCECVQGLGRFIFSNFPRFVRDCMYGDCGGADGDLSGFGRLCCDGG